jgi:hypothetical protein
LGTAAVAATVELAEEVKAAWDWYWAKYDMPGDNGVTAKDLRRLFKDEIESLGG